MKIIHGSLSALLVEVKEHGKVDGVRVAALMQSTVEGAGMPRYTSWVIVSAHVDREKVGGVAARGRAAARRDHRARVPRPRRSSPRLTEERARRGARLDRGGGARDARRHPRRATPRASKASWASMRATSARPAGADNFLKLAPHHRRAPRARAAHAGTSTGCSAGSARRPSPHTGAVRTSWPSSASRRGSARTTSSKLCRSLKTKGYIGYPEHRGQRGVLVEVAIDKFPLADGTYTALGARARGVRRRCWRKSRRRCRRRSRRNSRLRTTDKSSTSLGGRSRSRKRSRSSLRVRSADAATDTDCH